MNDENELRFDDDMRGGCALVLYRQEDGDVCIRIQDESENPHRATVQSLEICTPMHGGGKHRRLWEALVSLFQSEDQKSVIDDHMAMVNRIEELEKENERCRCQHHTKDQIITNLNEVVLTERKALRELFYQRINPIGETVEDKLTEANESLWRRVFEILKEGKS